MINGAHRPRFIFSGARPQPYDADVFVAPKFLEILNLGRHAQEAGGFLAGIAVATVCCG